MKPTISNAFKDESLHEAGLQSSFGMAGADSADRQSRHAGKSGAAGNPRKSLAGSLASMQVDLREAEFGWSLELSPMNAVDVLASLLESIPESMACLVDMEQSTWQVAGDRPMPIAEIAERLSISVIERIGDDALVLDPMSLRQLVSLCQPSRLMVTAVEGLLDSRDHDAIQKAIDAGRSPLLVELRAVMALEVLGDRAVVLHCRDKARALQLVADNFRHYLAALNNSPASRFAAPEPWQIERLLDSGGVLTVRPIETEVFSTSIDVGINTSRERFNQPANRSLIYDIPSNSWHDEP